MALFDTKYCDICGSKIGLLGNRKLEDGNLCKDCAAQLSPLFSERRHATVAEIRGQLAYRQANRIKAAQFQTTRSWGSTSGMLRVDDNNGTFCFTRTRDLAEENPDIIPLAAVTNAVLDIQERKSEITHRDQQGRTVSENPRRYCYEYDFYVRVTVNHPYFDDLSVKLNPSTLRLEEPLRTVPGRNGPGRPSVMRDIPATMAAAVAAAAAAAFNPREDPDFVRFASMGDELVEALKPQPTFAQKAAQSIWASHSDQSAKAAMRAQSADQAKAAMHAQQNPQPAPEPPKSAMNFCPYCGQKLDGPARFCPACGKKLVED